MLRASLYYHTLRHLRPEQFLGRLRLRLALRSVPVKAPPERARRDGSWHHPPGKTASLIGPARARFLNRERELALPGDWQIDSERLWLYNLHYFDDLNADRAEERAGWHRTLIAAWVRDNPPAEGVGWEPYPTSLRAVNWIKWDLAGNRLDGSELASLSTQLRYLRRRIEWHLLGNHVLVNAKALLFGGLFFRGSEPDEWLDFSARLLHEQLAEQVLPDGGHFERSPMYHALALEDVLDLLNLIQAYPRRSFTNQGALAESLQNAAETMLGWLDAMTHPDGEIAFFNDAAMGIALPVSKLKRYASALNIAIRPPSSGSADLESSGYVRLQQGNWCALFDAAAIGPDYQPGHAHADTLSFELSVGDERLISNSGTSTYQEGAQRSFERSTRAHNTVEIDGKDSSEVWAVFRVARRARPRDRSVNIGSERGYVTCTHNGYQHLNGRPVHRRTLEVTPEVVRWTDRVEGRGSHTARGFIPLHPRVRVGLADQTAKLVTQSGRTLVLSAEGIGAFALGEGTYAREFGWKEPRPVLAWELHGSLPQEAAFTLREPR